MHGHSRLKRVFVSSLILAFLSTTLIGVGCGGEQKPTFMNFYKKGEESVKSMEPIIKELQEEYKGKVIFEDIDMDLDENKKKVEEYHVQTAPTYVMLNKEGKVKETFMGAAHKEMLEGAISSQLPPEERPKTEPETTTPETPIPGPTPTPVPPTPETPEKGTTTP